MVEKQTYALPNGDKVEQYNSKTFKAVFIKDKVKDEVEQVFVSTQNFEPHKDKTNLVKDFVTERDFKEKILEALEILEKAYKKSEGR